MGHGGDHLSVPGVPPEPHSPHWRHIWWPLSWSGILGESYNQTSHSKNRVQSFKMKIFMKEQYFGSPLCSPSVQLWACHSSARVICSHYSASILSLLCALCSSPSVSSSRVFMSCLWLLSIDSSQAHFVDCVLMVRSCSYASCKVSLVSVLLPHIKMRVWDIKSLKPTRRLLTTFYYLLLFSNVFRGKDKRFVRPGQSDLHPQLIRDNLRSVCIV